MSLVLDDNAIRCELHSELAVSALRQAIRGSERGELDSPPRVAVDFESGRIVYTAGHQHDRWFGYRSYNTFRRPTNEDVVVLHDWTTGKVRAIAIGAELGARRTGSIGAVAVDLLAHREAGRLALVGTGVQAWAQLWAISSVRQLSQVLVWSRNPVNRAAFVARIQQELGLNAHVAESAERAVRESDVIVLATSSSVPVIAEDWIQPGSHVSTLGPKFIGRAEFNVELAERADVVATDSLAQVRSYEPPFILEGTPEIERMVSLGSLLTASARYVRGPHDITLFCSVGLAGTELVLLDALVRQREETDSHSIAG